MSDSTNILGLSPQLAQNLLAFGAATMQGANARTPQGFLANGPGALGPIGAGLQNMQQNQMLQAKLGSGLAYQGAQTQELNLQNQLLRTEMQMYPQVMSQMAGMMQPGQDVGGPSGAPAPQQTGQATPTTVPVEQRASLVNDAVKGTSVPPDVFGALVDHESNWDPEARSDKGALGLTQVMPQTAAQPGMGVAAAAPGTLEGPANVPTNLKFGAQYLDALGKRNGLNTPQDWALNQDAAARTLSMYYSGNANPTPENIQYAGSILTRAKAGWSGRGGSQTYQVAQAGNGPYPAPQGGPAPGFNAQGQPMPAGTWNAAPVAGPRPNNLPALQMGAGQPQGAGMPQYGGGAPQYGGGPGQSPSYITPQSAYNKAVGLYNQSRQLSMLPQLPGMPNFAAAAATLRSQADQYMGYALAGPTALSKPQVMRNMVVYPNGTTIRSPELEPVQDPRTGAISYQWMTPPEPGAPPGTPGVANPVATNGGQTALKEGGFGTQAQHEAYEEFAGPKETEGFNAANGTLGWLQQMDHSAQVLNQNGGFLQTGPNAPARLAFASHVNDVMRTMSLPPIYDPGKIAAWEELKKATVTAGFELSSHYEGHARQAAATIVNATSAVPSTANSPQGYNMVSAGIREGAQSAIDLHNYKQTIFDQNGDIVKANTDFYKQNPPQWYAKRAISTVTPYTVKSDKELNKFLPGTYLLYKNKLIQVPERPGAPPIPEYLKPQPTTAQAPIAAPPAAAGAPQVPTQ